MDIKSTNAANLIIFKHKVVFLIMKLCDWENCVSILQVKIFCRLCDNFVGLRYYYINGHVMKPRPIYLGKGVLK